jgi:activator of HSP90 ATPase
MTLLGLNPYSVALKAAAALLAAVVLFGAGYYVAVRQYDQAAATAAQAASLAATKAQAAKDAKDAKADTADLQVRATANAKATVVYQTLYRDRAVAVPSPKDCVVSPAAMHALNDPALVGSP